MSLTKTAKTLLLVDDEPHILSALKRCLSGIDLSLVSFSCPLKALEYSKLNQPDLVISDQRMPGLSGTELLGEIRQNCPSAQCMLLSAHQDFDAVAEAFNHKIINRYISKPWDNEELFFIVQRALDNTPLQKKLPSLNESSTSSIEQINFHGMISANADMYNVFESIRKAATANVPIFIGGETGTGKELTANACHQESYRKDQPFLAFNCANFNGNLMESQLFGHKKGAFTGANADQKGLFEAAGEGTLFLDEVTTLPLELQAKLLRVIQEREFSALGDHRIKSFNAHLVTASSTTLSDAVTNGQFREDLFYRLNVIPINLPPLCQRGDDVLLLADYFLELFNRSLEKDIAKFSDCAKAFLKNYRWPGNIRQLQNVIHNVVIMNQAIEVTSEMLEAPTTRQDNASPQTKEAEIEINSQANTASIITPLSDVEKTAIEHAITCCDGNIPKAAALLGVSPSTIYRKRQSWDIDN